MRLLPQYTAQGKMGVFAYLSVLILKSPPLAVGASQITNRVIVHENRSETKIRRHRIIHPLRTQKKTKDNLTSANPTSKCHMEMTNSMLFLFACNLSRHKNNAPPLCGSVSTKLPSPSPSKPTNTSLLSRSHHLFVAAHIFGTPYMILRVQRGRQRTPDSRGREERKRNQEPQPYIFPKAPLQKLHSAGQLRIPPTSPGPSEPAKAIDCSEQMPGLAV
jgi:hypothetical protein